MKLEIKHLAPYLPYKLEFSANSELYPKPTIQGVVRDIIYWNYHGVTGSYKMESIKPILKPLSDLSKQNGDDDNYNYLGIVNFAHAFSLDGKKVGVLAMPYFFIEELFKEHYDVFGLIEKGLAINLNDIK